MSLGYPRRDEALRVRTDGRMRVGCGTVHLRLHARATAVRATVSRARYLDYPGTYATPTWLQPLGRSRGSGLGHRGVNRVLVRSRRGARSLEWLMLGPTAHDATDAGGAVIQSNMPARHGRSIHGSIISLLSMHSALCPLPSALCMKYEYSVSVMWLRWLMWGCGWTGARRY